MSTGALHSAPPASTRVREALGVPTLLQVFLRSFFLQASWNPRGMQNLGLAYTVYPALKKLYPEASALNAAVRRHLAFFNTHPYVAAAIVGGTLFYEEQISRGEEAPERVAAFKQALMGPLAAVGDGFFWLSLKPAAGAVAAALVPLIGIWAPLVFFLLYNAVHLTLRARLYWVGVTRGDRLVEEVAREKLPARGVKLRAIAAIAAGGLAAWLALEFGRPVGGSKASLLTGGCLALGAVGYWAIKRGFPRYALLYLAALLAVLVGAFS